MSNSQVRGRKNKEGGNNQIGSNIGKTFIFRENLIKRKKNKTR